METPYPRQILGTGQARSRGTRVSIMSTSADHEGNAIPPRRDVRLALAERLRTIRLELFGVHGGPLLARSLGLPYRNWIDYESGAALPGTVLLRFIEATAVEPHWLLTGEGPMYREDQRSESDGESV